MGLILCIESSDQVCSVSLSRDDQLIAIEENYEGRSHATLLAVSVQKILKQINTGAGALSAVAVSIGPGSYTGLRIGLSVAKGICYGANLPLIAVNTLQAMANGIQKDKSFTGLYQKYEGFLMLCPMIDARRMEVYTALYSPALETVEGTVAEIVSSGTFDHYLKDKHVLFFGSGAQKCREEIQHPNAHFISNFQPSSRHMIPLANKAYKLKQFEDIAYIEPFYLKDFIATIPKKNIFR